MKTLKTNWKGIDRTPAHLRDVKETITCECGAVIKERFGELHHVGDCSVVKSTDGMPAK